MKIVFLDAATVGDASLEPIARFGELVTYPTSTPSEALERVTDAEVLIINKVKVTDELMAAAPKLRLICEAATGVNNIDLEAAARRGIPVRNVAGYSTESVVQVTFAHILGLMTQTRRFDDFVKDGSYSEGGIFTEVSNPYTELAGKTIGIIGMGTIGHRVAEVAEAFGMNVIYYSTSGTSHCTDYLSVSLGTLLESSHVVSIHCPLNAATKGLIGSHQLHMMNRNAVIVNMARGGIVDECALAQAISDGVIAGAALDVFSCEPLSADHPLLHTSHPERVIFTPHVGWASADAIVRLVAGVASNIEEFA